MSITEERRDVKMKVYALIGKSGTGKSYQAMTICKDKNIESIIDDGLFIYRNDILAGKSAKRETTKIGAVKTALFNDDDHKNQVTKKIIQINPKNILVIGTSNGMVEKITKRLELDGIDEKINIEEITTEGEREIAHKQRSQQGKHVVPVPTFQLKRQFSGYFMDPLRIFKGWGFGKESFSEKSVVRPTYSYLGDFIISDRVISEIVEQTAREMENVTKISRVIVENRTGELQVTILANFKAGCSAIKTGTLLQKQCGKILEEMTAFNIECIDVEVRGLE